jgi:hypothetical protein
MFSNAESRRQVGKHVARQPGSAEVLSIISRQYVESNIVLTYPPYQREREHLPGPSQQPFVVRLVLRVL